MSEKWLGAPLRRREDPRFLRGVAQYVGDIDRPNQVHAAFVRSPHAHARILSIDAAAARRLPGVIGVWTAADLQGKVQLIPHPFEDPAPGFLEFTKANSQDVEMPVLAVDRARYQGEAVAVVVAADPYVAEDARELVAVEYQVLPALVDPEAALAPGAVQIHDQCPGNLALELEIVTGDAATVLATAPVVVRKHFRLARNSPMAMETRGAVAEPDGHGGLTIFSATQMPHQLKEVLAYMLGLPRERVRAVAPDVGGGFGAKTAVYPEEAVVAFLALALGRPVKWIADRMEDLATTTMGRGQVHYAEAAFARDGTLLAVRDRYYVIGGAYNPQGILTCANSALHVLAPYRVEHRDVRVRQAFTNGAPVAPYRGSGRPEAVFVSERMLDLGARALGMDPAAVRLKNLVPGTAMPYDTGLTWRNGKRMVFDVGDLPALMQKALDGAGYDGVRRRQGEARSDGKRIGVGVAFSVEGAAAGSFETATVSVDPGGQIHVISGGCPHGQGHETVMAQVVAECWGVPVDRITYSAGDTATIAFGLGTWGSRGAVHQGNSILEAAQQALHKARAAAAHMLEVDPGDLEVAGGRIQVRGVPGRGIAIGDLAQAMHPGKRSKVPPELKQGLQATAYWRPAHGTFSSAADGAGVEVDTATGSFRLLDYIAVHDCGRVLNPIIVDGQIHGGVVQGLGEALFEAALYDGSGQLLARSLMDYLIPTAADVCAIRTDHVENITPQNALGVKGMSSDTCMNPPAAVVGALEDALAGRVELTVIPVKPEMLRANREA